MSRYQMSLLILCMLMISCSSNIVKAEVAAQTVDLFKPGETKATVGGVNYPPDGQVPSFGTYSLLDLNGSMAALAFGVYIDSSNNPSDELWARSFKYENKNISGVIGGQWDTQVVVKENAEPDTHTELYGPQAVVKGSKIFSLLTRSKKNEPNQDEILLSVGEVKGGGSITWNASNSLQASLEAEAEKNSLDQIGVAFGRGTVMRDKTIVFPLVAKSANTAKLICTVIFSEDDGNKWSFPSSPVISENCEISSLFEWEGSLHMARAYNPPRKLYESKDMGKTWTEAHGKLSHILMDQMDVPALTDIRDLVTATIEGKNVILFTTVAGRPTQGNLHLWFADNSRIHYAGQIAADAVDDKSLSTLLYAQDDLFVMYDKSGEASSTVVLAHLSNQLAQIKSVLKTWEDVDGRISPPSLTNGLVGFLSNKGNTTTWEDECLGVNATVKGSATKVDYGLNITLPGTQVVWPIGEQGDNQAYGFTNRGFTVVATVTIHNKPQSVTRLMGVELRNGGSKGGYTGLSYNKDKQWKGVTVDGGNEGKHTWEEGKAYQVALVFQDYTGFAYIDGKLLGRLEDPVGGAAPNANDSQDLPSGGSEQIPLQLSQVQAGQSLPLRAISRVSIGEEKGVNQEKEDSQVTVTNVLLYTRSLNTSELQKLTINNINTNTNSNTDTNTNNNTNTNTNPNNNTNSNTNTNTNTNNNTNTNTNNNNNTNSNTNTNRNTKINKNNNRNNRGDSSMYEHVSRLLLVLMGLLSLVTLC